MINFSDRKQSSDISCEIFLKHINHLQALEMKIRIRVEVVYFVDVRCNAMRNPYRYLHMHVKLVLKTLGVLFEVLAITDLLHVK